MTRLGKGCFWELFSPEWESFRTSGDKAPTSPSDCHPWSSGVTHWLSGAVAGVVPLRPGFARYAALPHISTAVPRVNATQPSPHGSIHVWAARRRQDSPRQGGVMVVQLKSAHPCPAS